ncbi:MAG: GNAT family N-acetyltransferase [Hyphomicrobium sp.]
MTDRPTSTGTGADKSASASSKKTLDVRAVTGADILAILPALAHLRMVVFRDWPYLYDGTLSYEEAYLAKFAAAPGAVVIVARDGDQIVGASTGAPMIEHADEFGEPFRKAGYDISKIFYCGESVLLKSHRGYGLGHAFFDGREGHARKLGGFTHSTFCRVVRPDDHPLKPADYAPLDPFWRKRGYAPIDGIVATYDWKDIDQQVETVHHMQFWMKAL